MSRPLGIKFTSGPGLKAGNRITSSEYVCPSCAQLLRQVGSPQDRWRSLYTNTRQKRGLSTEPQSIHTDGQSSGLKSFRYTQDKQQPSSPSVQHRPGQMTIKFAGNRALSIKPEKSIGTLGSDSDFKTLTSYKPTIRERLKAWDNDRVKIGGGDPNDLSSYYNNPQDQIQFVDGRAVERVEDQNTKEVENPTLEQDIDYHLSPFLYPGTLVELKVGALSFGGTLAVYVRAVDSQLQFYTSRGKWMIARSYDVAFYVPEYIPQAMLDPILPFMPSAQVEGTRIATQLMEGAIPRSVGSPIINQLTQLRNDASEVYRRNVNVFDNLHDIMAHEDVEHRATFDEIASKALGIDISDLTIVQQYAVHMALERHKFSMTRVQFQLHTLHYLIRSKRQLRRLEQVADWVREHQDLAAASASGKATSESQVKQFESFLFKARTLVSASRRIRSPTTMGNVGPSEKKFPLSSSLGSVTRKRKGLVFSDDDMMIVELLILFATSNFVHDPSFSAVGPSLLRAIGMYGEIDLPLDNKCGFLALQELGVLAPWENPLIFTSKWESFGHGINAEADRLHAEALEIGNTLKRSSLIDSMKDLRKDWGELPVFCVDGEYAQEIDDGFSLEPVLGTSDQFWVHIHVANPSAFIGPDHALARQAYYKVASVYSADKTYPMFPPQISKAWFSLAPNRPCITFSAKVAKSGQILDYQVTPGTVRNVVSILPSTLREILGFQTRERMTIRVGGDMPNVPRRTRMTPLTEVNNAHREILSTLQNLMKARRTARVGEGVEDTPTTADVDLRVLGSGQPYMAGEKESCHYIGDPIIEMSAVDIDPYVTEDSTQMELVNHVMLLAGDIAARWCRDRDIPVMFIGTTYHPEFPKPGYEDLGKMGPKDIIRFPRRAISSSPVPHDLLGMDQYVRCTSPLRRYGDMMVHWQIEAALREQATTGTDSTGLATLPFSKAQVDDMLAHASIKDSAIKGASYTSRDYWACQLMFRAFYFGEAALPETWECLITNERATTDFQQDKWTHLGQILPYRMGTFISAPEEFAADIEPGVIVPVRIHSVDPYLRRVYGEVSGPPVRASKGMSYLRMGLTGRI